MSVATIQSALGARDPETLVGPLLYLFTRIALHGARASPAQALTGHLMALALHPDVDASVRLVAAALAIEHRAHP